MKNKVYYQGIGSTFLLIVAIFTYIIKFYPETLSKIDTAITQLIRAGKPALDGFFLWITKFANPISILLLTLVFVFLFLKANKIPEAVWFGGGIILMDGVVNPLIKLLVLRARPSLPHMVTEHSYSFPSGHSLGSMVLYGSLIFLMPTIITNKKWCLFYQILLGCLIILIPISRVYLGVHYPTDVFAGMCLGAAWLFFTYPIFNEYKLKWHFNHKKIK